jgi:hypothetical protein
MRWVAFVTAASMIGCAGDLDAIRETQKKLLAMRGQNPDTRGAVPELTVLKHQLREWAEFRIANWGQNPDLEALTASLNAQFGETEPTPGDGQDFLGDIAPFEVSRPSGDTTWLQLVIGVGVECEFDHSLYLYDWRDGGWKRRYELEQNDYARYVPRTYDHVEVSPLDAAGDRLILTVANTWGCASSWQSLLYRLARFGSQTTTLIDGSNVTFLDDDPGRAARLEKDGALIEFPGESIDLRLLIRPHVLHFRVEGDRARRTEPLALTAQDFVDEWIGSNWAEIAEWTNPALREQHAAFSKPEATWEFAALQRCVEPAGQWQIEADREDNKSGEVHKYYFLVAQKVAYSFLMIDISSESQPGCPGDDPPMEASDPRPTLFPKK